MFVETIANRQADKTTDPLIISVRLAGGSGLALHRYGEPAFAQEDPSGRPKRNEKPARSQAFCAGLEYLIRLHQDQPQNKWGKPLDC